MAAVRRKKGETPSSSKRSKKRITRSQPSKKAQAKGSAYMWQPSGLLASRHAIWAQVAQYWPSKKTIKLSKSKKGVIFQRNSQLSSVKPTLQAWLKEIVAAFQKAKLTFVTFTNNTRKSFQTFSAGLKKEWSGFYQKNTRSIQTLLVGVSISLQSRNRNLAIWFNQKKIAFQKRLQRTRKPRQLSQKQLALRQQAKRDHLAIAIFGGSVAVTMCLLAGSFAVYEYVFRDLPSVSLLLSQHPELTTHIYDRNGQLLYSIYKDENRTLVPLSQIPLFMQHATIAIEDKEFYMHHGISLRGITRAVRSNIKGEETQGGSTITQQLVKNTLLSPERTLQRKLRELVLAWLVEESFSKDQILEMYLNEVAYGGSTYGIEAASERYFGKQTQSLSLAEAAYLAGVPVAPSLFGPFGSNPELGKQRQLEVLRRMVEDKYITQEQADEAKTVPLVFKADVEPIKAPHFVMYVKALLAAQYGEEMVNHGGLEVRTTLDLILHNQAQKVVTDEINRLARLRIGNGAALVTNPNTGEILSMVGSKDYFDIKNDGQVNVTTRPRQPGSSIKSLTYAIALEKGQTPATTIVDAPITFSIPGSSPYTPKNYDGKYHGTVTIRESLGSSYNIPAVKTLAGIGVNTMIDKAQDMGVTTWNDRKRFGLSLTLGGGEVLMTELSQVYGTFANGGDTVKLNPLLEVKTSAGEVMYRNHCALDNNLCPRKETIDPKVAAQITDILSDNRARTPAFGPRSFLYIPNQQVAVKTGTTNNLHDNWAIGYTSDRLVSVWVGNNDNTPMSYVASGVTGASPIWNGIMQLVLNPAQPHTFSLPNGLVKVQICAKTGTLPCRGCPNVREEIFREGSQPTQACNPAQFIKPKTPEPSQTTDEQDRILEGVTIEVR